MSKFDLFSIRPHNNDTWYIILTFRTETNRNSINDMTLTVLLFIILTFISMRPALGKIHPYWQCLLESGVLKNIIFKYFYITATITKIWMNNKGSILLDIDGWTDRRTDRKTDGRTDGRTDGPFSSILMTCSWPLLAAHMKAEAKTNWCANIRSSMPQQIMQPHLHTENYSKNQVFALTNRGIVPI